MLEIYYLNKYPVNRLISQICSTWVNSDEDSYILMLLQEARALLEGVYVVEIKKKNSAPAC